MNTSFNILVKILKILTQNYNMSYTLVELKLTNVVTPDFYLSDERRNQAMILEALILLNDINRVVLNSNTDEISLNINSIN